MMLWCPSKSLQKVATQMTGLVSQYLLIYKKSGTRDRTRTDTVFLPGDFESPASTNFATRAEKETERAFRPAILHKHGYGYNSQLHHGR